VNLFYLNFIPTFYLDLKSTTIHNKSTTISENTKTQINTGKLNALYVKLFLVHQKFIIQQWRPICKT